MSTKEVEALQDRIDILELDLECARRNENNVNYWTGQDDGLRGACQRWQEALTEVMPRSGAMQEPLESLYRQTEALRLELLKTESEFHLVRGQRDGYAYLLSGVIDVIEQHWLPHNEASRSACEGILNSLGGMHDAAWAAIKANATQPMTYAIEQRLRLIDFLLEHYGHVGRPELVAFFGVSIPCASADIQRYNEDNPGNAVYDFKRKRWTRTETFVPRFS